LWDCRRNNLVSNIQEFKVKIKIKHELERYIYVKDKDNGWFNRKWGYLSNILSV